MWVCKNICMDKVFASHIPLAILNGDNASKQHNLHVGMHELRYSVSHSIVSNSWPPHGLHVAHKASVHGILQARILHWVAVPLSRASSWPKDQTQISCIADGFFIIWDTREAHLRYMVIANAYNAITDTYQSAISMVQGGNSSALEYPRSFWRKSCVWTRLWRMSSNFPDSKRRKCHFRQWEWHSKGKGVNIQGMFQELWVKIHWGWKTGGEEADMRVESFLRIKTEEHQRACMYI